MTSYPPSPLLRSFVSDRESLIPSERRPSHSPWTPANESRRRRLLFLLIGNLDFIWISWCTQEPRNKVKPFGKNGNYQNKMWFLYPSPSGNATTTSELTT